MDAPQIELLNKQLIIDEDFRQFPYKDTKGILTIGVGRNLRDNGISLTEAMFLLSNDISSVYSEVIRWWPWVTGLSVERQNVILNVAFNCGVKGLGGFRNMLEAARVGNYAKAAKELLDSDAGRKLSVRYNRLANAMEGAKNGSTTTRS